MLRKAQNANKRYKSAVLGVDMDYEDDNYADEPVKIKIEYDNGLDDPLYDDELKWFDKQFDKYLESLDGVNNERELHE